MVKPSLGLWGSLLVLALTPHAFAESNTAPTPYLDALKQKLQTQDAENPTSAESYTEKKKRELTPKPEESYIDALKRNDPSLNNPTSSESFIEKTRPKIEPIKPGEESAIQAFNEGRSELKFKKEGEIHSAFGFRAGASVSRNFEAHRGAGKLSFDRVYGSDNVPDFHLFGEYQLFHHRYLGSLGAMASFGTSVNSAYGIFGDDLTNTLGQPFPGRSRTKFQFFAFPLVAAATYRFNLLQIVVPTITVGPALIGYYEGRDDDKHGHRGYSRGYYAAAGLMIPLNWISQSSDQELYYSFGVKRFSLSIEYSRLQSLSSEEVTLASSGVFAGMVFEY